MVNGSSLHDLRVNGEIIDKHIQTISEDYSKAKNEREQLKKEMKELKTAFNISDEYDEDDYNENSFSCASSHEQIISKKKAADEESDLMKKTLETLFRKTQPNSNIDDFPVSTSSICDCINENLNQI